MSVPTLRHTDTHTNKGKNKFKDNPGHMVGYLQTNKQNIVFVLNLIVEPNAAMLPRSFKI